MKYLTIIDSFYPSLSKTEKKVADYVKNAQNKIIYQTLNEISNGINVGEATILRFCYKVGFDGFQDLKLNIAKEENVSEDTVPENYIERISFNLHNSIDSTKSILNLESLEQTIIHISNMKRVFIYGIGASGNAALEMQSRLLRFGKTVHAVTDSHFQLMTSSILNENDLLIAFSLTGYTIELVDSVKLAKNNDAKVVAITNHVMSPVANLADIVLLTAGKESPMDGGSLTGKISQLYIADLICTGYALKDKTTSDEMREKTAKSVLGKTLEFKKLK